MAGLRGFTTLALSALLSLLTPTAALADERRCPPELDQALARHINLERASAGLRSLAVDERLEAVARGHSREMARSGRFAHAGLDGSSSDQRIEKAGYTPARAVGEVIATSQRPPNEVVAGWMSSQAHRAVLLGAYRELGVGCSSTPDSVYWTVNFGFAWPERHAAVAR